MNEALLSKWLWRFGEERDHLWRMVIAEKYGEEDGGWYSKDPHCPFGITLWKGIMKEKVRFAKGVRYEPGSGQSISFWHDVWLGERALCESFPELYAIATVKNAKIGELFIRNDNGGSWNIIFTRRTNDWELEKLMEFYGTLHEAGLHFGEEDGRVWIWGSGGRFSVKSLYKEIAKETAEKELRNEEIIRNFPHKKVWDVEIPFRICFFAWMAYLGRVQTMDNLNERGMNLVNLCVFCDEGEEEDVDHLLLKCTRAKNVWDWFFGSFGVPWVRPNSVKEALCLDIISEELPPKGRWVAKHLPKAIMWALWNERNRRIFDCKAQEWSRVRLDVQDLLFDWSRGSDVVKETRHVDFIVHWDSIVKTW
ncbi:mannosylglycoprotein endo-beta-mannosidase [Ranunculus cassubicifolius]